MPANLLQSHYDRRDEEDVIVADEEPVPQRFDKQCRMKDEPEKEAVIGRLRERSSSSGGVMGKRGGVDKDGEVEGVTNK